MIGIMYLGLLAPLSAAGDKKPNLSVSFHFEGEMESGNKHVFPMQSYGYTNYFRRVPEIRTKDIRAFTAFPSEDQSGYGIVLQLKPLAAKRLRDLTNLHQGRILLAMINGRPVDTVWINSTVNDGLLVIWKGVSMTDIRLADLHLPRLGEDPEKWKKSLKEKKRRRTH